MSDFVRTIELWRRVCRKRKDCNGCPIEPYCPFEETGDMSYKLDNNAVVIERKIREQYPSRLDYLREHFPNIELGKDGIPADLCCEQLGLEKECPYEGENDTLYCRKCWLKLMEEDGNAD